MITAVGSEFYMTAHEMLKWLLMLRWQSMLSCLSVE